MDIDFMRVFEILQDEEFKERLKTYAVLDLEKKAEVSVAVIYLAINLCRPAVMMDPNEMELKDVEELAAVMVRNKGYIIELFKRILHEGPPRWWEERKVGQ